MKRLVALLAVLMVLTFVLPVFAANSHDVFKTVRNTGWLVRLDNDGHGSAICITPDGYLLTVRHILDSETFLVEDVGGRAFPARKVFECEFADFGLLKIEAAEILPYAIVKLGEKPVVGDLVYSYGNPEDASFSFGRGMVNAIRMTLETFVTAVCYYIQTDALIERGSSGGGLFNTAGELIGVISFGYHDTAMWFAVGSPFMAIILGHEIRMDRLKTTKENSYGVRNR